MSGITPPGKMGIFAAYLKTHRFRVIWSAVRFLLSRAVLIGFAIFGGVFFTVLMANTPAPSGWVVSEPQFEANVRMQIERYIRTYLYEHNLRPGEPNVQQTVEELRANLIEEAGLNLPYWPRHLRWTWNALTFDWGRLNRYASQPVYGQSARSLDVRGAILSAFPNTLLLVGAANLIVFVFGLPLALYLSRHYGHVLDRLIAFLSPMSSVPGWVIGILLLSLFAIELRWLPPGGMFDKLPPETPLGYVPVVLRHMILPVTAIVISLFFQLVYSWRTFFIIYAQEDYVDLAKAKGLPMRIVDREYILRPTLPYIITSFALVLVGFWQMTMALEVVFQWPGIGLLYIERALPNFWGESMYPGELLLAVGIVVIFSYLLGIVVLLLDVVYVIVDPRIHLVSAENTLQILQRRSVSLWQKWRSEIATWRLPRLHMPRPAVVPSWQQVIQFARLTGRAARLGMQNFLRELRRYPSAIAGLTIILLLVVGSLYAVVMYPYEQIGRLWDSERLTGRVSVPRLAEPAWTNLFRADEHLSVARYDQSHPAVTRSTETLSNGWRDEKTTYAIPYHYGDFPQEIYLYIDARFHEKRPFVSLTWITPDGRSIALKGVAAAPSMSYDFVSGIPTQRLVAENPNWQQWFNFGQVYTTPGFYVLFADPHAAQPRPLHGTYHLEVSALMFEDDSSLASELLLLGHVYGLAGTDFLRRDLIVPLLWGMPFALVFGVTGALLTTLLAMVISAAGVWFGGWVDSLIQRLTEASMVLPVLAVGVLAYALFGVDIWVILAVIIVLNVFGTPAKTFRAAFLQVKEAPYIESARAYGASNLRIIFQYLVPRIIPVLVPQLVTLIPTFVFLEATLGLFNIKSNYPTWGRIIYQGLSNGALYGSRFWVLEPIALLLLTALAFSMLGSALERILNPRLLEK